MEIAHQIDTMKSNVEQISLDIVLNNAHSKLINSMRSANAVQVLWLSFKNKSALANQYAAAKDKKHLFDGRRKLSKADARFKDTLIVATEEAQWYAQWNRENSFQPIFQESLVTYCAAFENFLKTVAVVFRLANENKSGLSRQIYIPGPELTKARADMEKKWQKIFMIKMHLVLSFFVIRKFI